MTSKEIKDSLFDVFQNKLNLKITDDDFDKNFVDIGLNSLLFIKLLINLELLFDIEFEEEFINISYQKIRNRLWKELFVEKGRKL